MNRVIAFSLSNRLLVLALTLGLAGIGIWSALRLPIDAVPDVTNVQVQVNTNAPALSPVEVERQITLPVELAMFGLPNLEEIRSLSKFGLSRSPSSSTTAPISILPDNRSRSDCSSPARPSPPVWGTRKWGRQVPASAKFSSTRSRPIPVRRLMRRNCGRSRTGSCRCSCAPSRASPR
ncbi:MAG: efflux RND transporter permease subunit [Gemmatimonadetes bacterium]|nr:efflux RND transporter permease subunit [Gemmatimonadota bacterium]